MPLTKCPSSRVVPDHFYDFLHKLFDHLDDDGSATVCLSGAFSLNAHGSIVRPVSAIDMCVVSSETETVLTSSGDFVVENVSTEGVTRYNVKNYNDVRVCLFRHEKFPDNLSLLNVHGRYVQLYPAVDIIRYKVAMLSDRSSKMSELHLRKHVSDIISFLHNSPKNVRQTFLSIVPMLVKSVNLYCDKNSFSTRCEVVTNNDLRYEGLTFDIKLSVV